MEWSGNNHAFLIIMQYEIIFGKYFDLKNFFHPVILLPLIGEILLIITLVQEKPSKVLLLTGMACLSVIMFIIFFVGITSLNIKIFASTLPFFIIGFIILKMTVRFKRNKVSKP
jgi:hypothetical protein